MKVELVSFYNFARTADVEEGFRRCNCNNCKSFRSASHAVQESSKALLDVSTNRSDCSFKWGWNVEIRLELWRFTERQNHWSKLASLCNFRIVRLPYWANRWFRSTMSRKIFTLTGRRSDGGDVNLTSRISLTQSRDSVFKNEKKSFRDLLAVSAS